MIYWYICNNIPDRQFNIKVIDNTNLNKVILDWLLSICVYTAGMCKCMYISISTRPSYAILKNKLMIMKLFDYK